MRVRKKKFGELLEYLIENKLYPFGSIRVCIWDKLEEVYEQYHYCGLGTFTGIGYQYIISEFYVDSFELQYNEDGVHGNFYLSDEE